MCIRDRPKANPKGGSPSTQESPLHLMQCHFPVLVPQTAAKGQRSQHACHVCKHTTRREQKRKDTRFMCGECCIGLCVLGSIIQSRISKNYNSYSTINTLTMIVVIVI